MTPRLSIIAASIRRIGQAPTGTVESGDRYWDNVVLAMRMDVVGDSDPQFIDEKAHTVTVNGNVVIQTTTKKFGTGSAYFDGVGDYLTLSSSTDFDFGTGDFTVEAWIYPVTSSGMVLTRQDTNLAFQLRMALGNIEGVLRSTSGGTVTTVSGGAVALNTWTHIAITRSAGVVRVFSGGVSGTSHTFSTALDSASAVLAVGILAHDNTVPFNGYIDDLRITKGVARYTANFTPPGLPLPSGDTNNLAYDPYRANTVLLMHMDTNFTDVTGKVTTLSGCTISNEVYKFGGGSGYFNGSTSLSLPYSTDFDFGSGDFTLEAWIYLPNLTGNKTIIQRYKTSNRCWDFLLGGNVTHFKCSTNGTEDSVSVNGPIITANTWTHVAVVRYGSVLRVFTNGVAGTDVSFTGSIYATNGGPSVGMNQDGVWYFNGYIDDLRITKGIARYVGNFTPPAVTFKDN